MSNLFSEKNTINLYLSNEIVPIINVPGIWFEESEVLDFTTNDQENYNQFPFVLANLWQIPFVPEGVYLYLFLDL